MGKGSGKKTPDQKNLDKKTPDKKNPERTASGKKDSRTAKPVSDKKLTALLQALREREETVTTVESLTAGMISARIADIPGSSDVLKRAFVTYCDEAKHDMAGVRRKTLKKHTAVSSQTAKQMAKGGAERAHADACVSATGYAGPPSSPDDNTVGLVFLGCCYHGKTETEEHRYTGSRNEVRAQAMNDALRMLMRAVM